MMIGSREGKAVQALKAHLAINVNKVEESIDFYRRLWGVEPSKVRPGYAKFDVQNPPLNFTLNEVRFTGRGALSHLGIQVASTEDVLAVRKRWVEEGLLPRDEMQTSCCYALQDKAWVRDPDGNEWEVFAVLEDNLPQTAACECGDKVPGQPTVEAVGETTAAAMQTASACCAPALVGIAR